MSIVPLVVCVALGLGCRLLGDDYRESASAKRLRDLLWAKSDAEVDAAKVRGTGFAPIEDETISKVFEWPAGHVIVFHELGDTLALRLHLYGTYVATVNLCDEPELWRGKLDSTVYVLAPATRHFSGPHELVRLISAKLHPNDPKNVALVGFLEAESKDSTRPPYHRDGEGGVMIVAGEYRAMYFEHGERVEVGPFATESEARAALESACARIKGALVAPS